MADPIFAQSNYIAYVVLMPVNKIVSHLIDISVLAEIVRYDEKKTNSAKFHRYRLVLYYYITKRYIEALTKISPTCHCSTDKLAKRVPTVEQVLRKGNCKTDPAFRSAGEKK